MTYLRFHLIFNLPLLVVLGAMGAPQPFTPEEIGGGGLGAPRRPCFHHAVGQSRREVGHLGVPA